MNKSKQKIKIALSRDTGSMITRQNEDKQNKTGTQSQNDNQHGHQNAGMNSCAHVGYNGACV